VDLSARRASSDLLWAAPCLEQRLMVSLGVQDTGLIHFEKVRDGNGVIWRLRLRRPGRRLRNPWPSPDAAKFACDRSRLSCYLY